MRLAPFPSRSPLFYLSRRDVEPLRDVRPYFLHLVAFWKCLCWTWLQHQDETRPLQEPEIEPERLGRVCFTLPVWECSWQSLSSLRVCVCESTCLAAASLPLSLLLFIFHCFVVSSAPNCLRHCLFSIIVLTPGADQDVLVIDPIMMSFTSSQRLSLMLAPHIQLDVVVFWAFSFFTWTQKLFCSMAAVSASAQECTHKETHPWRLSSASLLKESHSVHTSGRRSDHGNIQKLLSPLFFWRY